MKGICRKVGVTAMRHILVISLPWVVTASNADHRYEERLGIRHGVKTVRQYRKMCARKGCRGNAMTLQLVGFCCRRENHVSCWMALYHGRGVHAPALEHPTRTRNCEPCPRGTKMCMSRSLWGAQQLSWRHSGA